MVIISTLSSFACRLYGFPYLSEKKKTKKRLFVVLFCRIVLFLWITGIYSRSQFLVDYMLQMPSYFVIAYYLYFIWCLLITRYLINLDVLIHSFMVRTSCVEKFFPNLGRIIPSYARFKVLPFISKYLIHLDFLHICFEEWFFPTVTMNCPFI